MYICIYVYICSYMYSYYNLYLQPHISFSHIYICVHIVKSLFIRSSCHGSCHHGSLVFFCRIRSKQRMVLRVDDDCLA